MKVRPMTWEYIAGFFDGEGTIRNNKYGNKTSIGIGITQSVFHGEVINEIKDFLDKEKIRVQVYIRNEPYKDKYKAQYRLEITSRASVKDFLLPIIENLRVKRDQAEKLLLFINSCPIKGRLTLRERDSIIELVNRGISRKEISKKFQRSVATINSFFFQLRHGNKVLVQK